MTDSEEPKRGFQRMSPERRREVAARGGAMVPAELRSFSKNRALAASAGAKGGSTSRGGGRHKPEESEA